jgi:Fe/S biogenesis protein NfuA
VKKLQGATVDLAPGGEGWTIENPNRPKRQLPLAPVGGHAHAGHQHAPPQSPAAAADVPEELRESLKGDTAQKLAEILDRHVNPSIAMHGGHADLVGVQDSAAYLRLSGGCQGCSMAAVTLRHGIERAVTELVPEITEVVDVTDHASGSDPYYQSSKG